MLIQKTNAGEKKNESPNSEHFPEIHMTVVEEILFLCLKLTSTWLINVMSTYVRMKRPSWVCFLLPFAHAVSPTWKIDSSFPLRTGPLEAGQAHLPLSLEPSCQSSFNVVLCLSTALSFLERTFHILRRRAIMTCYLWGDYLGGMCLFKPWSGTANQQQGTVPANLELKSSELGRRLVEC